MNGFVKRVGGFLPAEFIRVPVGESAVAAVHRPGFVAKAVVIFIGRHFLPDVYARTVPGHWQAGLIREQNVSGSVGKRDEQRRFRDGHMEGARYHLYFILIVVDLNGAANVIQRHLSQCPGEIFWKTPVGSDAHANHAVVKLCNANFGLTGCQFHTVLQPFLEDCEAFYFADVLPALSKARSAPQDAKQQPHSHASKQRSHMRSPDLGRGKKDLDAIELYPKESDRTPRSSRKPMFEKC